MATHASALKRHRQSERRRERNRTRLSQVKTLVKKTRAGEEPNTILAAYRQAIQAIDKAKSKGSLHWKTAARKISRLTKWVNQAVQAKAS